MKILLIAPPFYRFINYYNRYFPLGLAYLASVLRQEGYDVLVYDADSNINPSRMDFDSLEESYAHYLKSLRNEDHPIWKEMRETIDKTRPDVIGVSVWTTFIGSALKIASLCREYNKDIPVVMGGPHVTLKYDEIMKICPDVDFLVRGEGEKTFTQLVKSLARGGKTDPEVKNIKGISFRNNGEIIHNAPAEFIMNLDTVPLPARDLLINKASYTPEDMGLIMTSRGCPFSCSYCATSIWERKTRFRSVDNVINEINFVIAEYKTDQFSFKDDSFTVNRKRVIEFCDRLLKDGIKIQWDCNTRVNLVDEELLRKMKKAGCNSIKVGIETGSERILGLMNKGITFEQCRKAAELFRRTGIHWTGYFMMGLPGETKEDIYKTINFMKELRPDYASFSVYEPFPGTELFKIGLEKDLVLKEHKLEDFYTISPKHYYVKNVNRRVDTLSNEEFEKLENEIRKEFHKYNRGIPRILKRVRSRGKLYLSNPKILFEDFKKFLIWF